ncbi:MAG: hypothetical protein GX246_10085 [Clostridiales bacterium]|nr:hypothetical protein [Bacillota bacterium]NLL55482.1 hypothetical protein [Clostridiales bacterium]
MSQSDKIWAAVVVVEVLVFAIIATVSDIRSERRKRENGGIDPVEEVRFRKHREERERKKLAQTVVKTRILDGYSVTRGSGGGLLETAGRAMIGEWLGGPVGAIIGGATARRTYREYRYTTFKVWYGDGKTKIKTVSNGSYDWEKFIEKLEE